MLKANAAFSIVAAGLVLLTATLVAETAAPLQGARGAPPPPEPQAGPDA
jgi:hypothetical protein